jgi:hypothetical protein
MSRLRRPTLRYVKSYISIIINEPRECQVVQVPSVDQSPVVRAEQHALWSATGQHPSGTTLRGHDRYLHQHLRWSSEFYHIEIARLKKLFTERDQATMEGMIEVLRV